MRDSVKVDTRRFESSTPSHIKRNASRKVSDWRRRAKETLVNEAGGKCADCKNSYPPFMFDFDHRVQSSKEFHISNKGKTFALDRLRKEVEKCDLVCSNCHRIRTHLQRCKGCKYCE